MQRLVYVDITVNTVGGVTLSTSKHFSIVAKRDTTSGAMECLVDTGYTQVEISLLEWWYRE